MFISFNRRMLHCIQHANTRTSVKICRKYGGDEAHEILANAQICKTMVGISIFVIVAMMIQSVVLFTKRF